MLNPDPFEELRKQRDKLLKESDVYALPDCPHANDTIRNHWLLYRRELRELPKNIAPGTIMFRNGVLEGVTWCVKPFYT